MKHMQSYRDPNRRLCTDAAAAYLRKFKVENIPTDFYLQLTEKVYIGALEYPASQARQIYELGKSGSVRSQLTSELRQRVEAVERAIREQLFLRMHLDRSGSLATLNYWVDEAIAKIKPELDAIAPLPPSLNVHTPEIERNLDLLIQRTNKRNPAA